MNQESLSVPLETPQHDAVLVIPHLRVQNANAISSPLTWGFPAITAFTGLMVALERKLSREAGIAFYGVGVICHHFEAQVTQSGYTRAFHLTRNPVLGDGSTAAIVEEGRAHFEITLVFDVQLTLGNCGSLKREQLAAEVSELLAGMRIAGGSVMPLLPIDKRRSFTPLLELLTDLDSQPEQFRRLARRWLPGFALVSRQDLLEKRHSELQEHDPTVSLLDAWLDLSRWNHRAVLSHSETQDDKEPEVEWITDSRPGWIVPMPVGFAALSELYGPGTVAGTRDPATPFRFVETVWSIGQWISPHRLKNLKQMMWFTQQEPNPSAPSLYRCSNQYVSAESQDFANAN